MLMAKNYIANLSEAVKENPAEEDRVGLSLSQTI